ncbi:MAG: T9SS type A sorting domain-containing protein [candidate division WOR-3 bacterium]|nr:MAG: T9SS type A sorting domain-containing protein [candidate division WOR-3 bacterium]
MDRSSRMLYAAKGYKTTDFYAFNTWTGWWDTLSPMPYQSHPTWFKKVPGKGSRGCCDNDNTIYVTQGNNSLGFWKYHIAEDSWSRLPDVPLGPKRKKVKGGTDMAYVVRDSVGYVYLLKGYRCEFYRFNTVTEVWQTLPHAPTGARDKWPAGSWLVYDDSTLLYAHKAKHHELWVYDLESAAWDTAQRAGMPLIGFTGRRKKSKAGGCADWGAGNNIYAMKGGNTQEYWCYRPAEDAWFERETIPSHGSTGKKKRVKHGADIVHWGNGTCFTLKGNKTLEMWLYQAGYISSGGCQTPQRTGACASQAPWEHIKLRLGPNPLKGRSAVVRYTLPGRQSVAVRVFDAAGRAVFSTRSSGLSVTGSFSLDLSGLSAGVYLVRLDTATHTATRKLVVQR